LAVDLKTVQVRYFAAFREAVGRDTETVETAAATAAELFGECARRHQLLGAYPVSLVGINDEMADPEAAISEGDEVLFFPPVAGG
jgi:molybdopterin converting factor small subunit